MTETEVNEVVAHMESVPEWRYPDDGGLKEPCQKWEDTFCVFDMIANEFNHIMNKNPNFKFTFYTLRYIKNI